MNSLLNGRLNRGKHRGRTSMVPKERVSRLDLQEMIEDALDEFHARHKAGECWCSNELRAPAKRASEKRLRFKESRKPSVLPEYQVMQVERQQ